MKAHKAQLRRGDLFLLYTDGVTEAEDPEMRQFGEDRLEDLLAKKGEGASASQWITRIEAAVCFQAETDRVFAVLDGVLAQRRYAAGDEFSIADIAHFGWMWRREFAGADFERTPNVARWYAEIEGRPAVKRALEKVTALVPPS
jgi:glutathione S-transferase